MDEGELSLLSSPPFSSSTTSPSLGTDTSSFDPYSLLFSPLPHPRFVDFLSILPIHPSRNERVQRKKRRETKEHEGRARWEEIKRP